MACVENFCKRCNWSQTANRIWRECPDCKSTEVLNSFDECREDDYRKEID